MKHYTVVQKKERFLMGRNYKFYKRYKIGKIIFWVYLGIALVVVLGMSIFIAVNMLYPEEVIEAGVISFLSLGALASIPEVFVAATMIGGGRDILGARTSQFLRFEEEVLINVWAPRFKQIDPSELVGYVIFYKDIKRIDYNDILMRLEIYGKRTRTSVKRVSLSYDPYDTKNVVEDTDKPYYIYDYFTNMDKLIEELCSRTGLQVNHVSEVR